MRQKPDELGLCHSDGCGEPAEWSVQLVLRGSAIKASTTLKVCSRHQQKAVAFVLGDDNRKALVNHLVDDNWADHQTATRLVHNGAHIEFEPLPK